MQLDSSICVNSISDAKMQFADLENRWTFSLAPSFFSFYLLTKLLFNGMFYTMCVIRSINLKARNRLNKSKSCRPLQRAEVASSELFVGVICIQSTIFCGTEQ